MSWIGAAKYTGAVVRIAGLDPPWPSTCTTGGANRVDADTVDRAALLGEYFAAHALGRVRRHGRRRATRNARTVLGLDRTDRDDARSRNGTCSGRSRARNSPTVADLDPALAIARRTRLRPPTRPARTDQRKAAGRRRRASSCIPKSIDRPRPSTRSPRTEKPHDRRDRTATTATNPGAPRFCQFRQFCHRNPAARPRDRDDDADPSIPTHSPYIHPFKGDRPEHPRRAFPPVADALHLDRGSVHPASSTELARTAGSDSTNPVHHAGWLLSVHRRASDAHCSDLRGRPRFHAVATRTAAAFPKLAAKRRGSRHATAAAASAAPCGLTNLITETTGV